MTTAYTPIVKKQLEEYIKTPAVLVDADDVPYEYREKGSVNRLKRRRYGVEIPFELFNFIISNGVSKAKAQEFASGLILNYSENSKIFV